MFTRLPIEINPYRLIEQRRILNGDLNLKPLTRLQELTTHDKGSITVELVFDKTDTGLPIIRGSMRGTVPLVCQRCLHAFDYVCDHKWQLVLSNSDAEAEQVQENYEAWVVVEDRIFIQDFVEDELLLSLPIIAKHPNCDVDGAAVRASFDEESQYKVQKAETQNPFASLKQIFDDKA
jgi:uncharacterized protein